MQADFKNSFEQGFFDRIMDQIQGLDISILVNNVGIDIVGRYLDIPESEIMDVISINCIPMAILSRRLLPQMRQREQHRSSIINLNSIAGKAPLNYFSIYGPTKAFGVFFSRSLSYEYPDVDILSVQPGFVSTQMTYQKKVDLTTVR